MKRWIPLLLALLTLALPAYPVIIGPLPVTLQNGTTADANQVMSNFTAIVNSTNANAAALATTPQLNTSNTFTFPQTVPNATQAGHAVNAGQIQTANLTYFVAGGTGNAITLTPTPAWTSYQAGQTITALISAVNTGATTLNVSGLGAKNVLTASLQTLPASAVTASAVATFRYDGTQFQLTSRSDAANTQAFGDDSTRLATTAYAIGALGTQGTNVASVSGINLNTTTGDYVHVTGNTSISTVTLAQGRQRTLVFDNAGLVLVNSANLILPGGANINTTSGATMQVRGEAASVVRAITYTNSVRPGGYDLLSSKTAAASANITFTTADFDWAAYDSYEFELVQIVPATNTVSLTAQISDDAGSSFKATNYVSTIADINASPAGPTATNSATTTAFNFSALTISNNTSYGMNGIIRVNKPSATISKNIRWDLVFAGVTSSLSGCFGIGQYSGTTTAWNGMRFTFSSGNIASGKINVYGRNRN